MKLFIILFFLLFSLQSADKVLAGYLPSYRNVNADKIKHLNCLILFSAVPGKDGSIQLDKKLQLQLESAGKFKIPVYLTVGGWGKSANFPALTSSMAKRKVFISHIKTIVGKYKLSGIDYDWEHPKNESEEKAYESLIRETSQAGINVTVAAAGWQRFDSSVFKFIQRVNLMSYDHNKEHATLEKSKKDVESFIKMGCPPEKICLGVPFYGRHVEKRDAKSYVSFAADLTSDDQDIYEGYYFNNKNTLKKKAAYVKEKKLAGIMIWEIEQDDAKATLLKTLENGLLPEKN